MTTLGIQWLQHKEQERANKQKEAYTKYQIDTQKATADADRTSRENVASLDRSSRELISQNELRSKEGIAAADRASKESIADKDRASKESIETTKNEVNYAIAQLDRMLKEDIADLDRASREKIEEAKMQLDRYKYDLENLPETAQTMESAKFFGYTPKQRAAIALSQAAMKIVDKVAGMFRFSYKGGTTKSPTNSTTTMTKDGDTTTTRVEYDK